MIPIRLPSLRERREDVRALALHFVSRANQAHQRNVNLAPDALARLEAHDWPGNIRELGNLIERLVLLADHTLVTAAALERFMPTALDRAPLAPASTPIPPALPAGAGLVRDYQSAHSHDAQALQDALTRHQGNQSRAAQSLGLTLRQFSYRLRKAGLR
ncbi:Transcriptional regulatory protein ZraR [compost metagenome]